VRQPAPIPARPSPSELRASELLGPLPACRTAEDEARVEVTAGMSRRQVRYWLDELPRRRAHRAGLPSAPPPFIELRPAPGSTPLAVVLPSGLRVEVPLAFDPSHLRAVVDALRC
jgi:hypothetical protein